jgi:MoaA/NifB/PqqE/SkfB family radical SAM enzyme
MPKVANMITTGNPRAMSALSLPVLEAPLMAGPRPRHVVLGVNNFCNLRCVMCDVGTGNAETNFGANLMGARTRTMPWELFQRVADDMAAFCPEARLGFAFTEPLAWRPLGDALSYASALGLYTTVTTNGLLLPKRAAEFAAGRCRGLFVSLDGPAALHDRIRRHVGSFARAVEGIRAVAALEGAPEISVFCTISEYNVGHLKTFLADISDLPLKQVGLIHNNFVTPELANEHNALYGATYPATASNSFESDPTTIDIARLADELADIKATTWPFSVTIQPDRTSEADLDIYYRHPSQFIGRRCHDAFRILMIDADGESVPVHGRCYRFPIANVRDAGLESIWKHSSMEALRAALTEAGGLLPGCSRCCGGFGT